MAALLGVGRGSTAAPRQPALAKPSRRTPTQHNSLLKSSQNHELACTDILVRKIATTPHGKDGPSGTPLGGGIVRSAHRRSNNETPGSSEKVGSGRRSAAKLQLLEFGRGAGVPLDRAYTTAPAAPAANRTRSGQGQPYSCPVRPRPSATRESPEPRKRWPSPSSNHWSSSTWGPTTPPSTTPSK